MRSSTEEMFSEQPFVVLVQQVMNRSMIFGCALNFQEWRYVWEEQIREGLFRCSMKGWGISLIAAERTIFLLQPDGAMAFAVSTSQEREGGFPEREQRYRCTWKACENQAAPKTHSEIQN